MYNGQNVCIIYQFRTINILNPLPSSKFFPSVYFTSTSTTYKTTSHIYSHIYNVCIQVIHISFIPAFSALHTKNKQNVLCYLPSKVIILLLNFVLLHFHSSLQCNIFITYAPWPQMFYELNVHFRKRFMKIKCLDLAAKPLKTYSS